MAASILKTVSLWIERELANTADPDRQAAVIAALEGILTDTHVPANNSAASGHYRRGIPEDDVDDIYPGAQAGSILDTQVLACVRACMRARARVCVCARMCVCVCGHIL